MTEFFHITRPCTSQNKCIPFPSLVTLWSHKASSFQQDLQRRGTNRNSASCSAVSVMSSLLLPKKMPSQHCARYCCPLKHDQPAS